MFSVRQPPSQHAAHLRSGLISNFSNLQPHFKIQQIRETNYTDVTLISVCHSFMLYIPLCYVNIVTLNCRQQKYLLLFISDQITGLYVSINMWCPTGH